MTARRAAFFFRAFGDPTRLRLVALLSEKPHSVARLRRVLGCPAQRISRHLRYLHARGVVECESAGNTVVYRLAPHQHALHRRVLTALLRSLGEIAEVEQDAQRLERDSNGRGPRLRGGS